MDDIYYKKTIEYTVTGLNMKFQVSNEIFSSFQVDIGSDLLLRSLLKEYRSNPKRILDIGCGYGPIGITLAKSYKETMVEMVDRDLLAIRFAKKNAILNKVDDRTNIYGSVGLDEVETPLFDLVVSNIPAKVGDEVIEEVFIKQLCNRLAPSGEYWVVVVSGLNRLIPKIASRNKLNINLVTKRKGYSVYNWVNV